MFPKASLMGRVVRTNNTMRMAKSWGHSGGPVPARHMGDNPAHRANDGGEKAVPENIPRMLMRVRPTPTAHRRAITVTVHETLTAAECTVTVMVTEVVEVMSGVEAAPEV
jgi:hypothetical protein